MTLPTSLGAATRAPAVVPGQRVGDAVLRSLLGLGATAEVWSADRLGGAGPVAMKVMGLGDGVDAQTRDRFADEAALLARMNHTNILAIHGHGVDGSLAWIMMELADGGSLFDHLKRDGALPAAAAAALMIDVLDALGHAHSVGIIHRDVKPQNLLVDAHGRVLLSDFGVARCHALTSARTEPGSTLGSLSYMPPEQRLDSSTVGASADIYACASTLFALVTNRSPVDLHLTPAAHRRWSKLPAPLVPIVQRATKVRPEDRYPSADAMAEALSAALPALLDVDPMVGAAPVRALVPEPTRPRPA